MDRQTHNNTISNDSVVLCGTNCCEIEMLVVSLFVYFILFCMLWLCMVMVNIAGLIWFVFETTKMSEDTGVFISSFVWHCNAVEGDISLLWCTCITYRDKWQQTWNSQTQNKLNLSCNAFPACSSSSSFACQQKDQISYHWLHIGHTCVTHS